MIKVHRLKTKAPYFQQVRAGLKTAELRLNDREFQAGDVLELYEMGLFSKNDTAPGIRSGLEWDATGEVLRVPIILVTEFPDALRDGWVMLSLGDVFWHSRLAVEMYDEQKCRHIYKIPSNE